MRVLVTATAGLRRFLDILLVALVVVVLFGILLGKLVPLTGAQTMIVGGGSMEPAIPLGAVVIVSPVTADELSVGDVVSLRAGEKSAIYTHRIVDVVDRPDGRWVLTKGDANAEPDPTIVHASAIIGRTEFTVPYAGYLLQLLSIPTGVLFIVGLAAALLTAAWLLESLELERSERVVTVLAALAPDRSRGEPIAVGAVAAGSPAAGGTLDGVLRSTSERLARARAARQQRNPGLGSLRRTHRRPR